MLIEPVIRYIAGFLAMSLVATSSVSFAQSDNYFILAGQPTSAKVKKNNNVDQSDAAESSSSGVPSFFDLFRADAIRQPVLSPSGKTIAYAQDNVILVGGAEHGIDVIVRMMRTSVLSKLIWGAEDKLLVQEFNRRMGVRNLHAIDIGFVNGRYKTLKIGTHKIAGYIYDPLVDDPNHIIFAKTRQTDAMPIADLFRLNIFGKTDSQTKARRRLVRDNDRFMYFIKDERDQLNIGISIQESIPQVWRRTGDEDPWEILWAADNPSMFAPYSLSSDGKTLWAISNATTDKLAAVEFNMNTAQIDKVLFEHERFDLAHILVSPEDGSPLAVTYFDQGLYRYHFLTNEMKPELDRFQRAFPDQRVLIMGYSTDRTAQLIHVSSPQNPGDFYMCADRNCQFVESARPWLEDVEFNNTIAIEVESTDGLIVDAFLTIPKDADGTVPLIAVPHGGPIGVSDNRYFSSHVQWLAFNGYAVLQVNYRGSGGYGKEFLSAGLRQWGRGIEDDIEAAIQYVVDSYSIIDSDRIGIFGSSYGGYSALMSVIKRPDLYRCAASFAGVSDLTLLFNEAAIRQNESLAEKLVEMVGDPDPDYDELTEYSPVYRYKEFTKPLFIAHGNKDRIVDIEHSWRMRLMLNLIGIEPEFLVLPDVGHGFERVNQAESFYKPLVEFFDKHLKHEVPIADTESDLATISIGD